MSRSAVLLVPVWALLATVAHAQNVAPDRLRAITGGDLAEFIDPLVTSQLTTRHIAGALVVVVHQGAVVHAKGYGFADLTTERRMDADTVVRLASVSKTITAVAVMQLVEAGRLDLDRDVNDYIDFEIRAPPDMPVTLRRLLSHRSGFEYRVGGIASISGDRAPLGPFLARHLPRRLYPSGDVVAYSNYGAALAAYIVERAGRERFESYLERHIFRPLQMTSTTAEQPTPEALLARTTRGYMRSDLPPTLVSMGSATVHEIGSTAVSASGTDMGRLMLALLHPPKELLAPATLQAMMSPHGRVPHGFVGLGFYSPVAAGGNPFVGHDGGTGGFGNALALLPHREFGVFVSYNSQGVPARASAAGELLQRLAERYFSDARPRTSAQHPARFAGSYQPTRRSDSNFFGVAALLEQVRFRATSDGLAVGPAVIPLGGIPLRHVEPGLFRGDGIEAAFTVSSGLIHAQIGAPVTVYVRAPWWMNAGLIVSAVAGCVLFGVVTSVSWVVAVLRPRARGTDPVTRRLQAASRFALACSVAAIVAATWLVTAGTSLVVLSAPTVVPLTLGVYVAAWSGVLLTPVTIWTAIRFWSESVGGRWARVHQTLVAIATVVLAAFCLVWRIAGTDIGF